MSILTNLLSGGAAKLVSSVGGVIDNLHTSKEEKLEAERKIKALIAEHEAKMEQNITDRWSADMNSDSWLSKNVRPLAICFLTVVTMIFVALDSSTNFEVDEVWVDLLKTLLVTTYLAYFGSRGVEKYKKISK